MTCGGLPDHGEGGGKLGDVGRAHGIAVHRRGIERRLRQQRGERLGQRAPMRRLDGHGLGVRRLDAVEDAGKGVLDGQGRAWR